MSDEAMVFRIHCAVMQGFGLYWSPCGWMTRQEWAALMSEDDADLQLDWQDETLQDCNVVGKVEVGLGDLPVGITAGANEGETL